MKRKVRSSRFSGRKKVRKRVTVISFAAYILGLVLGIGVIIFIPFYLNRNNFQELAKTSGEATITYFTNTINSSIPVEYYLFTENGALVTSYSSLSVSYGTAGLKDIIPELTAKSSIYRIQRFKGDVRSRIAIVSGKTVYADSGRIFASFIVRDMSDMVITLLVFAGVFTLLFLISIFLILFIMKQHDDFLKMQRDLISNVSHELKTPITSITAMAELLYDGIYHNEDDRKRYSATILREADRLNELVLEILDLSRLQSNREKIEKKYCSAFEILTPLLDRYLMMCKDMGINLDTSGLSLNKIPPLYTDEVHIIKVFIVILDNAIKFAGKGGSITVTDKVGSDHVTICIRDDGPGISRKDINRIFDRFYKADVTRNSQGSGLGLAIAYEIIRSLKEKIWVESAEGEGSAFFFTISFN